MHVDYYAWRSKTMNPGAQIDLLLERSDKVINLCEIKYSDMPYAITKDEATLYHNRLNVFRIETETRCAVQTTYITPCGLRKGMYASTIQHSVTLNDLFSAI